MRIKHFIVTYNNNDILKTSIDSIFETSTQHERTVYVISNHSKDEYSGSHPVVWLRNATRPDFSTGHLSRNWNQALINGFKNLQDPDADILILSQNDCPFEADYLERCLALHEQYDLVSYGIGDNCVSYSPKAVSRVGLWDERFCNIGYQEADYFLRAAKYLGDRASINDGEQHHRLHNPIDNVAAVVKPETNGFRRKDNSHLQSMQYHRQSGSFFVAKWGMNPERWQPGFLDAQQRVNNFIFYPYFEKHIETLKEQMYLAFFDR